MHDIAVHPAVGAYMVGLIIHREYFNFHNDEDKDAGKDYYQQAREIIDNVAFSWIGPVFFVALGSKLLFDLETFVSVLPEALILFVALSLAKSSLQPLPLVIQVISTGLPVG